MAARYFIEQGETYEEAERKVREKYGPRATILISKSVTIPKGLLGWLFPREGVEVTGPIPAPLGTAAPAPAAAAAAASAAPSPAGAATPATPAASMPLDFEAERKKILQTVGAAGAGKSDPALLRQVLDEVKTIKERIGAAGTEDHATLKRLDELLAHNEFPEDYRAGLMERARKEFTLEDLNDYPAVQERALEWIGESIAIYDEKNRPNRFNQKPRIIVLVGPTGVGKTTTIAKLAVNFGIDQGRRIRDIALVTIDAFKIGAKEQLAVYGNILQFPCHVAQDYGELKKILALQCASADIVLVDTIGRSPRKAGELGEMKGLLDACGSFAEIYLALAATTKASDAREILQQFEPFNYQSVIVTKLDETMRAGNVIGVLAEKRKSVAYITDGQGVPDDLRKASVLEFLRNLEGFTVNRVKLEKRFPE